MTERDEEGNLNMRCPTYRVEFGVEASTQSFVVMRDGRFMRLEHGSMIWVLGLSLALHFDSAKGAQMYAGNGARVFRVELGEEVRRG